MSTTSVRGTVSGMARRGIPAFAGGVVAVAVVAVAYAFMIEIRAHTPAFP
ncbi:MAG: hypothetical protein ABEJ43_01905 [Haloferacaceae archaeon]